MTVDKELLLKSRLPEDEIEIEGLGTVRLHGLSRVDVLELQQTDRDVPGAFERKLVSLAMAEPQLTEDDVQQWQSASLPTELEPVIEKINELSGMTPSAAKDAYKEFDADPDAEFRLPAG